MSKHRVLSFKAQLRLEWRGQDGQNETDQPDHSVSLGDSITSSTRIRFSVHTALASLVASSPEAAEAFIAFCAVEASALLRSREHIVRALAAELRIKRTMDGAAIDRCIEQAVAAKAAEIEAHRRRDWRERQASAACLVTVKP
jgi:hypothetical protein